MKTCADCQYAIMRDHGYSNYTVEGTSFICSKELHPEGAFDRFFEKNPKLDYAEKCTGYEHGTPVELDVDGDWRGDATTQQHPAIKILKVRSLILNKDLLEGI